MNKKQKKMLARIIIAAVLLIALHFVPITGIPRFICYLAVYLVIGYDIVKKAFFGPVIPGVPASILQMHNDVILVGDEAALSLI